MREKGERMREGGRYTREKGERSREGGRERGGRDTKETGMETKWGEIGRQRERRDR